MQRVLFLFGLLLWPAPWIQAAETWAERLGYPAGSRVLILYADHIGAAYEINAVGKKLLSQGLVQSAGVMVPCPWFEDFAEWSRAHQDLDVGICLTLNSPSKGCRWRPLLGPSEVPSLVDADGYFWSTPGQAAVRVEPEEVERELTQQIEQARAAGLNPSHLIPAMGTLFMRPDLLEVYLGIAEKFWLPAVVVDMTPDHLQRFQQHGIPLTEEMQDLLRDYPLPKLDDVRFLPDSESYEQKREALYQLLRELPPGLCLIHLGPAEQSESLTALTPRWQQLVWEAQLLQDADVQAFLQQQKVQTTNWTEMMRRFSESTARPSR